MDRRPRQLGHHPRSHRRRCATSVTFTIYTPGSNAGVALNIVGSLQAPSDVTDAEVVGDEIEGFVSGLLSLVGIDADPLSSREHILLSNLILNEWTAGRSLDLPTLVGMIQQPPIRKLGVFELDQFFPPKDRMALAIRLNGLLASPSFGAWMTGPPLDIAIDAADGRRQAALRDRHHRPPQRSGAPVRHDVDPVEARHLDAQAERHHRSAGAAVHGRGRRIPAAHGDAADEEADHDA